MKRPPLYSHSPRPPHAPVELPADARVSGAEPSAEAAAAGPSVAGGLRALRTRHNSLFLMTIGAVIALVATLLYGSMQGSPGRLTQADIDAAVLHTLENLPPAPSVEAEAFDLVRGSVVRVKRNTPGSEDTEDAGTGVVVIDDGTILTSLHVVAGADEISVVFADGSESGAILMTATPEQDLAVIRARTLPDDLKPATLRSTQDLRMGDRVVAAGFPFGIGPSLSAGVISGLGREYHTPEGGRVLANLIQFDAAVNPGNSGGPLITMDGQVVGIVTAILNPSSQRFFVGIGFAVPIERAAAAAGMSPF
jgi:S1-C subfamily serine protease